MCFFSCCFCSLYIELSFLHGVIIRAGVSCGIFCWWLALGRFVVPFSQWMVFDCRNQADVNKDGSDVESDEENPEGDYTVYECPGLAPVATPTE